MGISLWENEWQRKKVLILCCFRYFEAVFFAYDRKMCLMFMISPVFFSLLIFKRECGELAAWDTNIVCRYICARLFAILNVFIFQMSQILNVLLTRDDPESIWEQSRIMRHNHHEMTSIDLRFRSFSRKHQKIIWIQL